MNVEAIRLLATRCAQYRLEFGAADTDGRHHGVHHIVDLGAATDQAGNGADSAPDQAEYSRFILRARLVETVVGDLEFGAWLQADLAGIGKFHLCPAALGQDGLAGIDIHAGLCGAQGAGRIAHLHISGSQQKSACRGHRLAREKGNGSCDRQECISSHRIRLRRNRDAQ